MATINDLHIKRISDLTGNELLQHFMAIRSRRRTVITPAKTSKSKASKAQRNPRDLLSLLSPEQAEELLKQLEEEDE